MTVQAPELWEPKRQYRNKKWDTHLRENQQAGPAFFADGLGVSEKFVRMYQRKLGVRKCQHTPRMRIMRLGKRPFVVACHD
jgi:hypothetical protein